jgi:signal transduction histidine kinase
VLAGDGTERLAALAHEMRNILFTGMLAFTSIEMGNVGVAGSTGAVLKKSLRDLSAVVDRSMAAARLELELQKRIRVRVAELIEQVGVAAAFQADDSGHRLVVEPVESGLVVDADPQILGAVIANLLHNAFKFTRPQTRVTLRAYAVGGRVIIEVADECGGLNGDPEALFRAHEQRGKDRSGLGLGLSISRRGVEANGGELHARDIPGTGYIFTVDLPRLAPLAV